MATKLILTILSASVLVNIANAALAQHKERPNIMKFFNSSETYELQLVKNQTEILIDVLSDIVDNVKAKDRGSSCTLITNYIVDMMTVKNTNHLEIIKQKLKNVQPLMNKLLMDFNMFPTAENRALKAQWPKMVALLFKFRPSFKFYERRMKYAGKVMEDGFSNPGKRRHRRFFNLLSKLRNLNDPANDENFMNSLAQIKADYRAGRL